MRWHRLFSDLEGQADELEREERDQLVAELAAGEWAQTSWHELLGGAVVLDVREVGRVTGEIALATPHVVHLVDGLTDVVVATSAVTGIISTTRRGNSEGLRARLGWAHVFRALLDEPDGVRLRRLDGVVLPGIVDAVGRDFVRLRDDDGRFVVVPFVAVVTVTSGR